MRVMPCGLLAVLLTVGCATSLTRPFTPQPAPSPAARDEPDAGDGGLRDVHTRAGREMTRAVAIRQTGAVLAEAWSRDLAEELAGQKASPTPETETAVAEAYLRLGILDKAAEHFYAATRLDPASADAWEGLARVWRDAGFLEHGLGCAYRAVSSAPDSPSAQNTLGTILQALGEGSAARYRFTRAVELDAGAAYAMNNLCYSWLREGMQAAVVPECRRATAYDSSPEATDRIPIEVKR